MCATLFPLPYIAAEQVHLPLWLLAGAAILVRGEREMVNFVARILRYNRIITEHDSGRVHVAAAYVQVIWIHMISTEWKGNCTREADGAYMQVR